ncbi:MAG: tRNA (adenosine(37)-N6)-dimethylallyltransferase MiaA [Actinomycetota bacterium]|nr:tRNA (adenosine(37)-N6)-dimethylallyltransferase MiaA [Actinomycetota bacterium]
MSDIRVAAIVGPTAVGKTELSLVIAEQLDAEIVSTDSMQVYRGMDIGTAKPTAAERERTPHHLLNLFDPSEEVTVAAFQDLARAAIDDIHARGRLPLLVGGSGLYFRAVVDDLKFPPRDPQLRAALEAEADESGAETLHARLSAVDPQGASKIEPGNARRTIRALEVIELTGRPFSDNDSWDRYESIYDLRVAGLTRNRAELYARIEARVRQMISDGLIEEARSLQDPGRTARQALGYRQILDHPAMSEEDLVRDITHATKRFARRQESWFRADPRVEWFEAGIPDLVERVRKYLAPVEVT